MHHIPRRRGFSLLELLAVVTILGILAAVVLPRFSQHAFDAKRKCCLQYRSDINSAVERYRFDTGMLPADLSDLQGEYYPDELPVCPVTKTDYTLNALGRVDGHDH